MGSQALDSPADLLGERTRAVTPNRKPARQFIASRGRGSIIADVTTTDKLARSGGVISPPDVGTSMAIQPPKANPDNMATAPQVEPSPPAAAGPADSKPAPAKDNLESLLRVEPLAIEVGLGLVGLVEKRAGLAVALLVALLLGAGQKRLRQALLGPRFAGQGR